MCVGARRLQCHSMLALGAGACMATQRCKKEAEAATKTEGEVGVGDASQQAGTAASQ